MKRVTICLTLAALLLTALPLIATAETVTINSITPRLFIDYKFNSVNLDDYAGQININWNGPKWAYCVDLNDTIYTGTTYKANIYDITSVTKPPLEMNSATFKNVAWLLEWNQAGVDTNLEAAALQAAIWKTIYGTAFELIDTTAGIQTQYTNYLASLGFMPGNFTAANYVYIDLYHIPARGCPVDDQDLITRVPEPGTLLLVSLGLVGLAGLRRKE